MEERETTTESTLEEFDLKETEEQIKTFEKIRVRHLKNKDYRKQCREILEGLRKERDGLRETIRSKAHQRVDTEFSGTDLPTR
jgi:ferritin-like metal-binding protein YciE